MRLLVTVSTLLAISSTTLYAQSSPSGPRAGAWGAEVSFSAGNDLSGGVMRFRSDRSAWLLGLDASVERSDLDPPGDLIPDESRTTTVVGGRFGLRTFRSPGSAIRPIVGGGVVGRMTQTTGTARSWEAGVYGELGLTRFFGESFAVGMTSDLQLRYLNRDLLNLTETGMRLSFDAVRVSATIVF